MDDPVLIVSVAGERAAIRASEVNTVTELEKITPVPRSPKHFCGISALRSRPLFVIDCAAALTDGEAQPADAAYGVVVLKEGQSHALAVAEVHHLARVIEGPKPPGVDLSGAWLDLCEGEIVTDDGAMMLIDPMRMIDGRMLQAKVA